MIAEAGQVLYGSAIGRAIRGGDHDVVLGRIRNSHGPGNVIPGRVENIVIAQTPHHVVNIGGVRVVADGRIWAVAVVVSATAAAVRLLMNERLADEVGAG